MAWIPDSGWHEAGRQLQKVRRYAAALLRGRRGFVDEVSFEKIDDADGNLGRPRPHAHGEPLRPLHQGKETDHGRAEDGRSHAEES